MRFVETWLDDVIHVAAMAAVDTYGQAVYGLPAPVRCRVEGRLLKVVDASGQEIMSGTQIACMTRIGLQDRIWLPGVQKQSYDLAGAALVPYLSLLQWQIVSVQKRDLDLSVTLVLEKLKEKGDPSKPGDWDEIACASVDSAAGIFTFKEPGHEAGSLVRVKAGAYLAYPVEQVRVPLNVHKARAKGGGVELFAVYL